MPLFTAWSPFRALFLCFQHCSCTSTLDGTDDDGPPAAGAGVEPPDSTIASSPKPRKRALLIGIEHYENYSDLQGPRQDLLLYRRILKDGLKFTDDEIIQLSDDEDPASDSYPSRQNMKRELQALGTGLKAGDLGFLGYTGHAVQLNDRDAESEFDGKDEAIVPPEGTTERASLITDKQLNKWLVAPLPAGATLLVVCDSCHSETILDLPFKYVLEEDDGEHVFTPDKVNSGNKDSTASRVRTAKVHHKNRGGEGLVLCLSACKDDQNAHELKHQHTGKVYGAMSALLYHLFSSVSKSNGMYNPSDLESTEWPNVGSSGPTSMQAPTVEQILVTMRAYYNQHRRPEKVQITSSKEFPNPRFSGQNYDNSLQ